MTEFQPLSTYLVFVLEKKKDRTQHLTYNCRSLDRVKTFDNAGFSSTCGRTKTEVFEYNEIIYYTNSCLVPRRLSFHENVRAKEGGKETTGVCTLPVVPCGSSLVACLYLTKNEAPEEEAVQIALRTLCKGCYRISKVFVFSWTGKNLSNTLSVDAHFLEHREKISLYTNIRIRDWTVSSSSPVKIFIVRAAIVSFSYDIENVVFIF